MLPLVVDSWGPLVVNAKWHYQVQMLPLLIDCYVLCHKGPYEPTSNPHAKSIGVVLKRQIKIVPYYLYDLKK